MPACRRYCGPCRASDSGSAGASRRCRCEPQRWPATRHSGLARDRQPRSRRRGRKCRPQGGRMRTRWGCRYWRRDAATKRRRCAEYRRSHRAGRGGTTGVWRRSDTPDCRRCSGRPHRVRGREGPRQALQGVGRQSGLVLVTACHAWPPPGARRVEAASPRAALRDRDTRHLRRGSCNSGSPVSLDQGQDARGGRSSGNVCGSGFASVSVENRVNFAIEHSF